MDKWIVYAEDKTQARLRLFCFPCAGGDALLYRPWVAMLPPAIQVCPVELPGRGSRLRQPPFTHMTPLVNALAQGLQPYLDRPFAFWGHSMGALVAFELARLLRGRYNQSPQQLFVSAHRAPHLPNLHPDLHLLPDKGLVEYMETMGGTPPQVMAIPELMELFLPILRADLQVLDTYSYTPAPPLDCPIVALGGLEDPTVSRQQLEAWREQTSSTFRVQMFPGGHFYLQPAQALLIGVLGRALETWVSGEKEA